MKIADIENFITENQELQIKIEMHTSCRLIEIGSYIQRKTSNSQGTNWGQKSSCISAGSSPQPPICQSGSLPTAPQLEDVLLLRYATVHLARDPALLALQRRHLSGSKNLIICCQYFPNFKGSGTSKPTSLSLKY